MLCVEACAQVLRERTQRPSQCPARISWHPSCALMPSLLCAHTIHWHVRMGDSMCACLFFCRHAVGMHACVLHACMHAMAHVPSPTLSPTDPVPRGLLTLCPGAYVCVHTHPGHRVSRPRGKGGRGTVVCVRTHWGSDLWLALVGSLSVECQYGMPHFVAPYKHSRDTLQTLCRHPTDTHATLFRPFWHLPCSAWARSATTNHLRAPLTRRELASADVCVCVCVCVCVSHREQGQ